MHGQLQENTLKLYLVLALFIETTLTGLYISQNYIYVLKRR